jgi:hypothetical protein
LKQSDEFIKEKSTATYHYDKEEQEEEAKVEEDFDGDCGWRRRRVGGVAGGEGGERGGGRGENVGEEYSITKHSPLSAKHHEKQDAMFVYCCRWSAKLGLFLATS